MKYELVIFDLDGTLLDTLDDLKNAVNHVLELRGAPKRTREEVRSFIGNGIQKLLARALPAGTPDNEIAAAVSDFKAFYGAHLDVETTPYPGIIALLKKLRSEGLKIGINSNKYDAAVQSLCKSHFDGLYDYAYGESAENLKKPSPVAANRIVETLGVKKSRTLYVGDSMVDLETAKNAALPAAWVSWGFRTRTEMGDLLVPAFDTADDLLAYLLD